MTRFGHHVSGRSSPSLRRQCFALDLPLLPKLRVGRKHHTASERARQVTGGIGRGSCAPLARIWEPLALVGTSLGPNLGPTT
jgi:hypothetical protein